MSENNLPELLSKLQSQELASNLRSISLSPFSLEPKAISPGFDVDQLFDKIYDSEAKRLGLSPERYEYTCINELYKNENPIFETHYFMYDGGSDVLRGFLGNLVGTKFKEKTGIDIGNIFENICFSLNEVLYIYPTVDVSGYGIFHSFFNMLNSHLMGYNYFLAYIRERHHLSFRYGFNDLVGLIHGVSGEGLGEVTAGEIDPYPVHKIVKDKYYEVEIKGGKLLMAPFATCTWEIGTGFLSEHNKEEALDCLEPEELPVKSRETNTFHFLNGATPHYFRHQTNEAMWTIIRDGEPWDDD